MMSGASCVDSEHVYRSVNNQIHQWAINTGQHVKTFEDRTSGNVLLVHGDWLFADQYGTIGQWSIKSGRQIRAFTNNLEEAISYMTSLVWRPGRNISCMCVVGRALFAGKTDGRIEQWCIQSGKLLRVFMRKERYQSEVIGVMVRDMCMYCGYEDGQICQWSLFTGQCVKTSYSRGHILAMCANKNNLFVSIEYKRPLRLKIGEELQQWRFSDLKCVNQWKSPHFHVDYMCANDKYVYSAPLWGDQIKRWDLDTGENVTFYDKYGYTRGLHLTLRCLICVKSVSIAVRWDKSDSIAVRNPVLMCTRAVFLLLRRI